MAWLMRRGEVLASLERAGSPLERAKGFAPRQNDSVVLLVEPSRAAHSIGLHCPLDIAHLDADLTVVRTTRLAPNRIALARRGTRGFLEAPAGAFERWHLRPGDQLEITE